jgi:membrane protease YdiL (CAAX protease family)
MGIGSSIDSFFEEWDDSHVGLISLVVAEAIIIFLILAWVVVNIPSESARASIFLWLLLGASLVAGLDTIAEKNLFFAYVDYGNSVFMYLLALVVGGLLAIFLTIGTGFSIIPTLSLVSTGAISFLYVVIAAPFVEEKFFRGFLNPNAGKLLNNFKFPMPLLSGVILSSITFGLFHFIAYGGVWEAMLFSVVFGLIASVGNYAFKTRSFGLGLHIVVNFIAVGGFALLVGAV